MRRLALALLASTALAATASAADLRSARAPSAVAPVVMSHNWTGFYVGGHVGWGWAENDWSWTGWGNNDRSGFLGGLQVGFDYQIGQWVVGLEGDVSWLALDDDDQWAGGGWWARSDNTWISTVTGRLGYAFDRTLLYVKGGVAFGDNDYDIYNGNALVWSGGDTRTGWTLGAGVEWSLMPNWSVKLEYNYIDFGDDDARFTWAGTNWNWDVDHQVHAVKLGLNYRFGGYGKAPAVVTKY